MAALLIARTALLSDPDWFLDRMDPIGGFATFVRSDRKRLAETLFLDGRASFSLEHEEKLPFSALAPAAPGAEPPRFIMHMSFCGSTQLAHLLDASEAALVLKEPHALVDLADWHRSLCEQQLQDRWFKPMLSSVTMLLSRRWDGSPPTVIKPSNWANPLLPQLLSLPDARILLVTIEPRDFLRAILRGGRDRLAFTARAAAHLAAATGRSMLVQAAIESDEDPLDRAIRLAVVTHEIQRSLFHATGAPTLEYGTIFDEPETAVARTVDVLALKATGEKISTAVARRSGMDSKNSNAIFSPSQQDQENRVVEGHHGARIDRALEWAQLALAGTA